jgi:hypothetical protein
VILSEFHGGMCLAEETFLARSVVQNHFSKMPVDAISRVAVLANSRLTAWDMIVSFYDGHFATSSERSESLSGQRNVCLSTEETLRVQRTTELVLTPLGAVFLLAAAFGKHPYGFYILLRLIITVGAIYWASEAYRVRLRGWVFAFACIALLMNPFIPIRMHRTQWQQIDLWVGLFLLGWSGFWYWRGVSNHKS